ncbi:MAG TPA: bifunctional phosphoglucose/phosphomannose isomerase [Anaerolineaceae bacterium]|nr:bifunctional phosphoglucose/phosphomannose isomerase [Anaerolineaceae bacterium]
MNYQDPENMLGYIDALPDDLEKAWSLGHELELPEVKQLKQIVISGMGGSAIGGDFLASYLSDRCLVPIISRRNYDLPAFAKGRETLVICSSHSGNTEETVSGFKAALGAGCSVLALCTGGYLASLAEENHSKLWIFEHHGQPRTAISYSFGMLLAMVARLGLVSGVEGEVRDAIATMRAARADLTGSSPLSQNPARRLAGQLLERNVAIFGAGDNEVVARRWKTQINELAKAWASFEGLPEMNHNTLAGLLNPESLYNRTSAIFLRAELDHPRNQMRLDATIQSFLQAGIASEIVWARGKTKLAQMWSLLQFGDYVSYYLALLYGVDPTPVDSLSALKQRLAKE